MIDKTRAPPKSKNKDLSSWSLELFIRQRNSAFPDKGSMTVATIKAETFRGNGRVWKGGGMSKNRNQNQNRELIKPPVFDLKMSVQYISGKWKSTSQLVHGNFIIRRQKSYKEKTYWLCSVKNCPVKLTVANDTVMSAKGDHAHSPPNIQKRAMREKLREQCYMKSVLTGIS